ncbi:MAG TPA: carbohydrate kinase family protein [Mycobacteriales bacterium]|nr:carbohydrate kinase family protein [Mycobacteriales bacterium]
MRVAVTGSIATDHLMTFPGRFADQLLPDQLGHVSLSFLVDELVVRRGGVAANICYGMAQLGGRPALVGAVGADFDDYRSWLDRHGVDTSSVHVSEVAHTARFLCTTDRDQNQIASFYPGAMAEAREIALSPVGRRLGGLDLVVIGPNDPEAMLRHTDECRGEGLAFVADPSQQLSSLDGDQIRRLVDGAAYLFTNQYELALLLDKTGWSSAEVLDRVGVRVTTQGAAGVVIDFRAGQPIQVPTAAELRKADPTGVGDAFRAGYLSARGWQLDHVRSAQVGCLLATLVLETVGTQEYDVEPARFLERLGENYGPAAADEVRPHLVGVSAGAPGT